MILDPEFRTRIKLLVDALRSGKYQQGRECLQRNDKFCCLGVACDVYHLHTGEGRWIPNDQAGGRKDFSAGMIAGYGLDIHGTALPHAVSRWFGFVGSNPGINGATAITYNDQMQASFDEIADAFERTYLTDAA